MEIMPSLIRLTMFVMTKRSRLAAIKEEPSAIRYIKYPSVEEELAALDGKPLYIEYIENPSPTAQSFAVNQDGRAIHYIKNPTDEVAMLAKLAE